MLSAPQAENILADAMSGFKATHIAPIPPEVQIQGRTGSEFRRCSFGIGGPRQRVQISHDEPSVSDVETNFTVETEVDVASLTTENIQSFTPEFLANIPAEAMVGFAPEQISNMPADCMAGFSIEQLGNLTSEALGAISGVQLTYFGFRLSLTASTIASLSDVAFKFKLRRY